MQIAESGDTLHITTYREGNEEGLQVRFDRETGSRLKEYYKKNNRYDGLYREYDPATGELVYEATYELDGSTARRGHWCATTGSTIGKPALTSTDARPVPSSRAT